MRIFYILIILSSFLAEPLTAQSPDWIWAKSIGGTGYEVAQSMVIDDAGNVYTTGSFQGTVDFDAGVGISNLTAAGTYDAYVLKSDSAGNFIWAKQMGQTSIIYSLSIALDPAGNVHTTGNFNGTIDFDPGPGIFTLNAGGNSDIFILKLDSSGNFIWAKNMGGLAGTAVQSRSIKIDNSGNVYAAGFFTGSNDFDPDPTGNDTLTSLGGADVFIVKLDSAGNFIWAKAMGGTSEDNGSTMTIDSLSNVYTAGNFRQTADFDPGAGVFNLTSPFGTFISKLDSSGNFVWAKGFVGTSLAEPHSIAVDIFGNVLTTGVMGVGTSGTVDFDPGPVVFNLTNSISANIQFISKLNNSGNFVWAKGIGNSSSQVAGFSIAVDPLGSVYTSIMFNDTVDFNPGPGTFNLIGIGSHDVAICKLNSLGNFVWAKAGTGPNAEDARTIALDGSGNLYLTGFYRSPSLAFGTDTITNEGNSDVFIVKLENSITTGNNEVLNFENDILVFPNPMNDYFIFSKENRDPVEVTIKDLTGKLFYPTYLIDEQKTRINTNDLAAGLYILQIQSKDFVVTKKIIVSR